MRNIQVNWVTGKESLFSRVEVLEWDEKLMRLVSEDAKTVRYINLAHALYVSEVELDT